MARLWARATLWGLAKCSAAPDMRVDGRRCRPHGGVLVASKHMSMWDTLALYHRARRSRHRAETGASLYSLLRLVSVEGDGDCHRPQRRRRRAAPHDPPGAPRVLAEGRPILIFPEGTRKKPGAAPDYKPGVAGLYGILKVPLRAGGAGFRTLLAGLPQAISRHHQPGVSGGDSAGPQAGQRLHAPLLQRSATNRGPHIPRPTGLLRSDRA